MSPVLTLLYVPGDRPDRVVKALATRADVVIVDLEDAVAAPHKATAREALTTMLDGVRRPVQVRVNPPGSAWHEADVAALAALPPDVGARVPKVASPESVVALAGALPGRALHLLVEDAVGLERAYDLARAHPQLASIGLGEADMRSQLGVTGEEGLAWARSRIVVAARAAGLPAPHMSVFANVRDPDGLAASCALGSSLGLLGRAAIHPAQLDVIEAAFTPSAEEVERAREVVRRVGDAAADAAGTVVLADGTFLDVAMVERARQVLEIAERRR